jgi:AmmeMemoRadiSam system protein B
MPIRNHAVAGSFYPGDRQELSSKIEEFLKRTNASSGRVLQNVHGLIVPHAGYAYSGKTAGKAYQYIIGRKYSRVIILCPNHTMFLNKVAFDSNDQWTTPLGVVNSDKEAISKLDKNLFVQSKNAHLNEHAIEVQLPFLQKLILNFKIVPLIVGTINEEQINCVATELMKIINNDALLIVSTDLSHFLSEHNAQQKDAQTIKNILSLDEYKELDACGSYALKVAQTICRKKKWSPKLIEYTNSGIVTEDKSKVVGYASFWF